MAGVRDIPHTEVWGHLYLVIIIYPYLLVFVADSDLMLLQEGVAQQPVYLQAVTIVQSVQLF